MNLNEFHQSFKKSSILTPDIRKQPLPQTPLASIKAQIKVQQWFTTRGSYVHKPMARFSGHPPNFFFFKFLKILMVSHKTSNMAFRIHKTLQTKPSRKNLYFHYLPKLYIAFNFAEGRTAEAWCGVCTCHAAGAQRISQQTNISQCIVDEAGMSMEPESLIPMCSTKPSQIVLIGDHQQLRSVRNWPLTFFHVYLNKLLVENYLDSFYHNFLTLCLPSLTFGTSARSPDSTFGTIYFIVIFCTLCSPSITFGTSARSPDSTFGTNTLAMHTELQSYCITYGERTFAHAAPIMWNNLPDSLRSINSMEHFKSALKTYLFELSLWYHEPVQCLLPTSFFLTAHRDMPCKVLCAL